MRWMKSRGVARGAIKTWPVVRGLSFLVALWLCACGGGSAPPGPPDLAMAAIPDLAPPAPDLSPPAPDLAFTCATVCSGACVDTRYDPDNCGACASKCPAIANGLRSCIMGICGLGACGAGYRDCNGVLGDGCEINTASDVTNCGGCGKGCAVPNATAGCALGACTVKQCNTNYDDCNKVAADGCETNLQTDIKNCGACNTACDAAKPQVCDKGKCVDALSFNVLETKNITYSGINYVLVKVTLRSKTAVNDTWCTEYQKLCELYGAVPTGCGNMYTSMNNGYGACRTMYKSDGISDSLGCNASSGVAAAARANGYADATDKNSFAFHYCDGTTCAKDMCTGDYCNTALSYIDLSKTVGYTLCKK